MPLSQEEIAHWRHRLREEESKIVKQFNTEERLLDDEDVATSANPDDSVAWAEREGTKDFLENLEEGRRHELRAIGDAWHRLDAGTFGVCEVCGEPIPTARLEALPYASICMRCHEEAH